MTAAAGNGTMDSMQAEETEAPPALLIDFDYLQGINSDVAGWIDFPGQDISYPVVLGNDNEYYLHHTFRKEDNFAGSIFVDSRNRGLFVDDNTIIYGHNMKNGSMFGKLKRYMEQDHYEQYPCFDVYTPEMTYRCRIIAACRVRADMKNYPVTFADYAEREKFVQEMKDQCGYVTTKAQMTELQKAESLDLKMRGTEAKGAPLVMLSTCVGNQHDYRWILLAEAEPV